jgi:hypothetical protein
MGLPPVIGYFALTLLTLIIALVVLKLILGRVGET